MLPRLPRWVRSIIGGIACCLLSAAAAQPRVASGIVALHNNAWDNVRVEVRLGPSTQCDLYDSPAVRTLKRGGAWAVVADQAQVVCWRREASPGAAPIVWTAWQTRVVPSAGVDDVTL